MRTLRVRSLALDRTRAVCVCVCMRACMRACVCGETVLKKSLYVLDIDLWPHPKHGPWALIPLHDTLPARVTLVQVLLLITD